jgi:hypothetical protein
MAQKCQSRKQDGTICSANAQVGSDLCVFHDPTKADDGQRARRAGGLARGKPATLLPADCPDVELANSKDVSNLLAQSISQVRRGELDPRVANTIGYLSGILLKALEHGVLEERVQKLEIAAQEERQGALNPLEIPDPTRGSGVV